MTLFGKEWKLANDHSLFSFGEGTAPTIETRLYEELENGYKLTVKGEEYGEPYEWGYTAFYDGEDHPVYGRDDVDAIEPYKINDDITIGFFKKENIYAGPYARKLDARGESLTVQTVGRDKNGAVFFDVKQYHAS